MIHLKGRTLAGIAIVAAAGAFALAGIYAETHRVPGQP
jgi:hypothetical protein